MLTLLFRLFIGKTLGMGEPTTYTCIATDVDPYEVRDQFTGAQVTFRVGKYDAVVGILEFIVAIS